MSMTSKEKPASPPMQPHQPAKTRNVEEADEANFEDGEIKVFDEENYVISDTYF